jgi:hypothetical protein
MTARHRLTRAVGSDLWHTNSPGAGISFVPVHKQKQPALRRLPRKLAIFDTSIVRDEELTSVATTNRGRLGTRRTVGYSAMKNNLTRRRLGAAFALAAFLLAGTIIVVPKVTATTDAASADPYGIDILALNPEHE